MFRALVVVSSPVEVELEDLIVSIQLSSTEDALVCPKVGGFVELLKWYNNQSMLHSNKCSDALHSNSDKCQV